MSSLRFTWVAAVGFALLVSVSCSSEPAAELSDDGAEPAIGTEVSSADGGVQSAGDDDQCVDVDWLLARQAWVEIESPDGETIGRVLDAATGTLTVGNFYEPGGSGTPGERDFVMKIYWLPDDPKAAETAVLTVNIENLDEPSSEPVIVLVGDGFRDSGGGSNAFTNGRSFWASGIPLPAAARWRLTADVAGEQHGCVEFTLQAA